MIILLNVWYDCLILHYESLCEMSTPFLEWIPTDDPHPSFARPLSRSVAVCNNLQLDIFQAMSRIPFMIEYGPIFLTCGFPCSERRS